MNTQYKRQGGWVASFLIVGTVLVLVVIGGLWYVKSNQTELAGTNETSDSATENESTPAENEEAVPTEGGVVPQNDADKGEVVDTNGQGAATGETAPASTPTTTLPATGPEDTFGTLIIVSILTFSTVTYLRSRQRA